MQKLYQSSIFIFDVKRSMSWIIWFSTI